MLEADSEVVPALPTRRNQSAQTSWQQWIRRPSPSRREASGKANSIESSGTIDEGSRVCQLSAGGDIMGMGMGNRCRWRGTLELVGVYIKYLRS